MPLRPTAFFYLGLLPVIILLWAWADSPRSSTAWYRSSQADQQTLIENADHAVHFHDFRITWVDPTPSAIGPRLDSFTPSLFGDVGRHPSAPSYFSPGPWQAWPCKRIHGEQLSNAHLTMRITTWSIPHWLILTAYLPVWLTLSYWLSRRKQKQLISALPTAPQQVHTD